MISAEAQDMLRQIREERAGRDETLEESRARWTADAAAEPLPEGVTIEALELGGVPSERVVHPDADGSGTFLLLHGGGYRAGNCITHRKLAAYLSQATGMEVYVPDYGLAPERPFPAGVDDAVAAYQALLGMGVPADRLVVGGDSAGGGLSAALLLALKDKGLPQPLCGVLLSPWTDILCRGPSYEHNVELDPIIDPESLREAGRAYFNGSDPEHPLVSPVGAELSGLPPLLIHVGEAETMLDDSTSYAQNAADAGVDVTLEVWPGMWHVWHQWAPDVPEAQAAIKGIGAYVRAKLAG